MPFCVKTAGGPHSVSAELVLSVVEEENALLRQDCGRAAFGERGVEHPLARLDYAQQISVRIAYRAPVHEVVGSREVHELLAPVHKIPAADLRRYKRVALAFAHNGRGLRGEIAETP